jgi:hypothetical protein
VLADLVLDGCDDGGEKAVLRRFVLPVYGHFGGVAGWGWRGVLAVLESRAV